MNSSHNIMATSQSELGAVNNKSTSMTTAEVDKAPNMTTEETPTGSKCLACKGSGSRDKKKPAGLQNGAVDITQDVFDEFRQLPKLPSPLPKPHPAFVHCMPPEPPTYRKFSVFTAGSIEMGEAVQWQKQMALMLSPLPITVNNPRRGNWDPNATQEAKNEAFRQQVEWELSALEQADVICFFFDVNTISPVTMMELGLWAASDKVVVCCNKRFWRVGNVHLSCGRYEIPFVEKFEELVPAIKDMLVKKGMKLDDEGNLIGSNTHVEKPKPKKNTVLEWENAELQSQLRKLQAQVDKSMV